MTQVQWLTIHHPQFCVLNEKGVLLGENPTCFLLVPQALIGWGQTQLEPGDGRLVLGCAYFVYSYVICVCVCTQILSYSYITRTSAFILHTDLTQQPAVSLIASCWESMASPAGSVKLVNGHWQFYWQLARTYLRWMVLINSFRVCVGIREDELLSFFLLERKCWKEVLNRWAPFGLLLLLSQALWSGYMWLHVCSGTNHIVFVSIKHEMWQTCPP